MRWLFGLLQEGYQLVGGLAAMAVAIFLLQ
jgi:hypothetical protein